MPILHRSGISHKKEKTKLSINRLLREPLLHFLLVGSSLFILYSFTNEEGNVAPNRIVIGSGKIEQLSENFKRSRMRPPTEAEMTALVENYVREEVFYREALAMGLDQNDPIVRQRMNMKLEFILEDLSSRNITDEKLTLFMQQNPDKFRMPVQISFEQVYLNPDKRKDLDADAKQLLVKLNDGVSSEILGDRILLPFDYSLVTQSEIANSFGKRFAEEVMAFTPGDWIGPVNSEYGVHLLKINKRVEERKPKLRDIRAYVEREYLAKIRKEQKDLAYKKLREGYDIIVEPIKSIQINQVK